MAILSSDGNKILNNYDRFTGVPFNASKVTLWYDGTPLTDAKVDNAIYFKNKAEFGGGYSKRDFDNAISVLWFGAKGDGVTDDTLAIQKAINFGLPVEFPDTGNYYMSQKLTLKANCTYSGKGKIKKTGTGTVLFDIPFGSDNIIVRDLTLENQNSSFGAGAVVIGQTGTSINNLTSGTKILNCKITGCITVDRGYNITVEGNTIKNGSVQFNNFYDRVSVKNNIITHDQSYGIFNAMGANATDATPVKRGRSIISGNIITVYRMGIEWRDRTATVLSNDCKNLFSNNTITLLGSDSNSLGISLNSDGWVISDNTIERLDLPRVGLGMEIVNSYGNIISNNFVSGFSIGIDVYGPVAGFSAKNNIVSSNRIIDCNQGISVARNVEGVQIIGNFIHVRSTSLTDVLKGISVDIDNSPSDGTYGTYSINSVLVSSNQVFIDMPTSTKEYIAITASGCINTIIQSNLIKISGASSTSRAIYPTGGCDDLIIKANKCISIGTPCLGIALPLNCGRRIQISENTFVGFSRGMDFYGGQPYTSIRVADNYYVSCINSPRIYAGSYSSISNGLKVAMQSTIPTAGTWNVGDIVHNTGGGTGWKCSSNGSLGVISGKTVSPVSGSPTMTINNLETIEDGQYIAIAGLTGTKKIISIDRVLRTITIDSNAATSLTDAALTFVTPVFVEYAPTVSRGTFTVTGTGQSTIAIPHGLGAVPSYTNVTPKSAEARAAAITSWTENGTNITLTVTTPNTGGSLVYSWEAKV